MQHLQERFLAISGQLESRNILRLPPLLFSFFKVVVTQLVVFTHLEHLKLFTNKGRVSSRKFDDHQRAVALKKKNNKKNQNILFTIMTRKYLKSFIVLNN